MCRIPSSWRARIVASLGAGLLLAVGATAAAAGAPGQELVGRVVVVADGDTLTLLVAQESHRIRLAQIDAPESSQPGGRAAKRALSELCFGKEARVVVVAVDRYGRTVGEVFVGSLHLNREMVRSGNAWAYTEYATSTEIVKLEDEAREAGRGLWGLQPDQREPPWSWRRRAREGRKQNVPAAPSGPLVCGRVERCTQMTSCEEARFYFEECGLTRLDGDGDGVPCEKLCRNGG